MICIYEGEGLERLSPLCDLRPAFDLRCGRFTLLEKYQRLYPNEPFFLWVRDEVAGITAEAHPDCRVNASPKQGRLFLSATAIFQKPVPAKGPESVLLAGDEVVGFRVGATRAFDMNSVRGLLAKLAPSPFPPPQGGGKRKEGAERSLVHARVGNLAEEEVKAKVVRWPWELVELNAGELLRENEVRSEKLDAGSQKLGSGRRREGKIERGVVVAGERRKLHLEPGSRVWPAAVISTETGPVFIDRDAVVKPGSFVEGPCYIGTGTIIDGAKVRPGASFGPECRIGGEVQASIFQGYANKHHEGFIGHAFVGEWTNLGALTTNSDLKNAYQPVQVTFAGRGSKGEGRGQTIDTGLLKVGCFIGDHAKTAIGTLINTGARIGTFANWFEPGLSPKEIPAFAWGGKARWPLGHVISNARKVMARRGVTMSEEYERALRTLYSSGS